MSVASQWNETPAAIVPAAQRRFPALLVLFACSGCAALIYEIVWFQSLELVIGSSAISLGILLGTFMGGMCLGSLRYLRLSRRASIPFRVYAAVELGIGLLALLLLFGMPLVGGVYTAWAGPGAFGMALRGVVAGVCLLPPTFLMGAIFRWSPVGSKRRRKAFRGSASLRRQHFRRRDWQPAHRFLLLRLYDIATATYVAVALNAA